MAVADRHQSWLVDDADFPAAGNTADLLRFALRYAVLAPSSHNSQPWLFFVCVPGTANRSSTSGSSEIDP